MVPKAIRLIQQQVWAIELSNLPRLLLLRRQDSSQIPSAATVSRARFRTDLNTWPSNIWAWSIHHFMAQHSCFKCLFSLCKQLRELLDFGHINFTTCFQNSSLIFVKSIYLFVYFFNFLSDGAVQRQWIVYMIIFDLGGVYFCFGWGFAVGSFGFWLLSCFLVAS